MPEQEYAGKVVKGNIEYIQKLQSAQNELERLGVDYTNPLSKVDEDANGKFRSVAVYRSNSGSLVTLEQTREGNSVFNIIVRS